MDTYANFEDLAKLEKEGDAFAVRFREKPDKPIILSIHGGSIEPGTSEIADAIAGDIFGFYSFEGKKRKNNSTLHITSSHFDEPRALKLTAAAPVAIAIHGERSKQEVVYIGGGNQTLVVGVQDSLLRSGFSVESHEKQGLQGVHARNICNRCASPGGVQLELSLGLRKNLFRSLSPRGRTQPTDKFDHFVRAVQLALLEFDRLSELEMLRT